jgi:hypothetical protein
VGRGPFMSEVTKFILTFVVRIRDGLIIKKNKDEQKEFSRRKLHGDF